MKAPKVRWFGCHNYGCLWVCHPAGPRIQLPRKPVERKLLSTRASEETMNVAPTNQRHPDPRVRGR